MALFHLQKHKMALKPASVYLSATYTHNGRQVPGRLLPATLNHEGRTYRFDGVDRLGAKYSLDAKPD